MSATGSEHNPPEQLRATTLAAFAAPSLPIAALGLPMVVFLPEFYANAMGLNLALVGSIFMIVRILDILFDPLLGGLIDRTRSRFGRFRTWLVAGTPLLMAGVYAAFSPPEDGGIGYLASALLLLYIPFSICHIAHMSWGAGLSGDYDQRSRIYGWWQAGNILGMVAILLLPAIIAARGGSPETVVPTMGLVIVIVLPIAAALAARMVPDPPVAGGRLPSPLAALGLLRRKEVRRLLLSDLAFGLAPGVAGAAFLFFFREVKGFAAADASLLLLANFLAAFAGAPLWGYLARRLGKHRALALSGVLYACAHASLYFAPSGNLAAGLVLFVLIGLPFAAPPLLLRAMMADVSDVEQLERGADSTGLLFSLVTAVSKLGYALSVGTAYLALEAVGFQARSGVTNSAAAVDGLQWVYLGAPAACALIGAAIIAAYPLDRTRHAAVRAALEERRSG